MTAITEVDAMKRFRFSLIILAFATAGAAAQSTSSSASFQLLSAEPGAGGGKVSGGAITAETSTGDAIAGGVSGPTADQVQGKGGYTGQLYDVAGVEVSASPSSIGEGATSQLSAQADLDDDTKLALVPTELVWSVLNGPVTGISTSGVATAGLVYEDRSATLRGSYAGFDDDVAVTVLDVDPDNFGGYAGDEIDDDWQVGFFGLPPNADAGPGVDADGDEQSNLFEFLAGFSPVDRSSFFELSLLGFGAPGVFELSINKVIPGRTYTLLSNTDLNPSYLPVGAPFSVASEEADKPLQDTGAGVRQFYKVRISKP